MVALDYFSVFLIFYQFLIFHSAQALNQTQDSCPKEFQCGNLGKLSFPFSISSQPACGLYTIDCDVTPNPKIHLGEDVYTGLNQRAYDNSFRVLDLRLNDLLAKKSCHSFDRSLAFPSSPSISFRTNRNLTLFKCSNSSTNDHFFRGYEKYTKCRGFSIYYKYPSRRKKEGHSDAPQGDASDNCSQILLPIQRSSLSNTQKSGLFDFLTANFKLRWSLSDDCNKCYSQGGRCLTDSNNNFHCSANSEVRKSKRILVAVAATSVGVIAVLVVLLLYLRTKYSLSMIYWKLTKREDYRNVKAFLKNHGSLLPRKYSFCEVKKMTQCLKNKLGQGGYGCVYKGKLHDGSLVAVKVLKESKGRGEEFINEVASISRTSHVNIVSLVGFCFEGRNRALLYDFMPNGSLEKFIYDAKFGANRQLGWQTLYDISLGIARGLEYLHRGCNTRILHFDIKPHNILLDEDFCPKISDFGLAKLCNKKESIVSLLGARGTIGYIAPEIVCKNIGGVSHKSDVYSYGMMVLEMVGGRKNIDVAVDHTSEIYFPYWIYTQIEQDLELGLTGIVKEEDKELAEKMILVSLWCIQTAPASRPSMSMVVDMLQGNLGSLQMPHREPRQFIEGPGPFNLPSNQAGGLFSDGRFQTLPGHPHGGEIDGLGDLRGSEHATFGHPYKHVRSGDLFGKDVPSHLHHVEPLDPQKLPSHLCFGEPAGFGPFAGRPYMGELSGFGDIPGFGESIGRNKPGMPRFGEPGFRSRYPVPGFLNHGLYAGDVDSFDRLRKRKPVSMGWCRICKVDCETVEGLDMHSQTREHQDMAMDMVRSIKEQNRKKQKTFSDRASVEEKGKTRKAVFEGRGRKT